MTEWLRLVQRLPLTQEPPPAALRDAVAYETSGMGKSDMDSIHHASFRSLYANDNEPLRSRDVSQPGSFCSGVVRLMWLCISASHASLFNAYPFSYCTAFFSLLFIFECFFHSSNYVNDDISFVPRSLYCFIIFLSTYILTCIL
jgi:hypothetical protein